MGKLWQVVPFRSEKLATHSRQDQEAIRILETKTVRVEMDGILRCASPLLCRRDMLVLQATRSCHAEFIVRGENTGQRFCES